MDHGPGRHDLHGLPLQILEFENGKRLWVLHPLYGDQARDLIEALLEHGAHSLAFVGTAGSLDPALLRGEVATPSLWLRRDGTREDLSWIEPVSGVPRRGAYRQVTTPHLETLAWAEEAAQDGVDLTDVELGYALEAARRRPQTRLKVVLAISDVLRGPRRSDLTEWGRVDPLRLVPHLNSLADSLMGFKRGGGDRLSGYRIVPLAE